MLLEKHDGLQQEISTAKTELQEKIKNVQGEVRKIQLWIGKNAESLPPGAADFLDVAAGEPNGSGAAAEFPKICERCDEVGHEGKNCTKFPFKRIEHSDSMRLFGKGWSRPTENQAAPVVEGA